MSTNRLTDLIGPLRRTVLQREAALWTDGQLLERYLAGREELPFALLVERHGPMVLGVCRRLLGDGADAEDAFQATFLVLVKKAATVRPTAKVGNWLYGVAVHTARRARAAAARRRLKEKEAAMRPAPARPNQTADLVELLDQELSHLPDKYRTAIVLCDLEGHTRKEAARHLGCPEGTVAGRLARARVLLAKRLGQRGVALSGGVRAAALAGGAARAAVPAELAATVVRAGALAAAGKALTGVISTQAVVLAEGVVKTMIVQKLKLVALAVLLVFTLSFGAVTAYTAAAKEPDPPPKGERETDKRKLFDDAEVIDAGILYLEDKQLRLAADGKPVFENNLGGEPRIYGSNGDKIVVLVHNPDAGRGRGGAAGKADAIRVFSARTGKLERDCTLATVEMPAPKLPPQPEVVVSANGKTCWFCAMPRNGDKLALIEFDLPSQSATPFALPKGMSDTVAQPLWLGCDIGVADQRQVAKWDREAGKFVTLFADKEDDPDARGRYAFLEFFGLVKFNRTAKKVVCLTDKNLKPLEHPTEYPLESRQSFGPMEYTAVLHSKFVAVAAVATDEETRISIVDLNTGKTTTVKPLAFRASKIAPGGNGTILLVAPDKQAIVRFDPANGNVVKLAKVNAGGQWVDGVGLVGDPVEVSKPGAVPEPKPAEDKGKELRSTVRVQWKGRAMRFSAGPNAQVEGLTLAVLGSCSVAAEGDKKGWQAALDGDHVLVTYSRPRVVGVGIDEKVYKEAGEVLATEILLPLGPKKLPDHVWVRYEDGYRKYAKYQLNTVQHLQDLLNGFRPDSDEK